MPRARPCVPPAASPRVQGAHDISGVLARLSRDRPMLAGRCRMAPVVSHNPPYICLLERLQNYSGAVPRLPESRLGIVSFCRPRGRPEVCLSPSRAGIAPMWGQQSPQASPGVGSRLYRDRRRIRPGPSHGRETISRSLRERPHAVPGPPLNLTEAAST